MRGRRLRSSGNQVASGRGTCVHHFGRKLPARRGGRGPDPRTDPVAAGRSVRSSTIDGRTLRTSSLASERQGTLWSMSAQWSCRGAVMMSRAISLSNGSREGLEGDGRWDPPAGEDVRASSSSPSLHPSSPPHPPAHPSPLPHTLPIPPSSPSLSPAHVCTVIELCRLAVVGRWCGRGSDVELRILRRRLGSLSCQMDHFPSSWGRPRNESVDLYSTYPIHQGQNWEAKAFGLEGGQHGATQAVEHTRSVPSPRLLSSGLASLGITSTHGARGRTVRLWLRRRVLCEQGARPDGRRIVARAHP